MNCLPIVAEETLIWNIRTKYGTWLTSLAVIPNIIRDGSHVLKAVTPSETWIADMAVSLLSVLRSAGVPVISACPEPSADDVCCAVN